MTCSTIGGHSRCEYNGRLTEEDGNVQEKVEVVHTGV